jgi:hypothetical protein
VLGRQRQVGGLDLPDDGGVEPMVGLEGGVDAVVGPGAVDAQRSEQLGELGEIVVLEAGANLNRQLRLS